MEARKVTIGEKYMKSVVQLEFILALVQTIKTYIKKKQKKIKCPKN